ncbi:DUF2079 domain-containing protein [Macrococcus animalis]|uniref:DUF2079 domain-containing protein n=1 Tax=Macrococcus animalis TaxID=3395467 RepID=UPI0039BDD7E5
MSVNHITKTKWQKMKELIFSHWFYYLLSGFTFVGIFLNLFYSEENLFFRLTDKIPYYYIFSAVLVLSIAFYLLVKHNDKINAFSIFSIITGFYFLISSYNAPSPTIVIGFIILSLIILAKLIWDNSQIKFWYSGLIVALLIKMMMVFKANGPELYKFSYVLNEKDEALIKGLIVGMVLSVLFIGITTYYTHSIHPIGKDMLLQKIMLGAAILICILITIYVSCIMFGKDTIMGFATYDKGLFTQMFESMRQGYGPMTTLERDKWMSHFNVHVSPIFFLMLPFYMIIPRSETLEILQVIITFSGIIPFYFILNHFNFNKYIQYLLLFVYIFMPTLSSSHLYGLHENCFLTPMIFWLILANLKQWKLSLIIILILTLIIKEDSMIYILSIGLYFLIQNREPLTTNRAIFVFISQIILPIFYFIVCLYYLNNFGDGSMTTRFTNFMMPGQDSLMHVVQNIIANPTYFFSALFTFNKIKYLLVLLASLAFLPVMQNKIINYILLLPMLVINLLSDFPYQVDFGFQYHYGSSALLLFLVILAIESLYQAQEKRREHDQNNFVQYLSDTRVRNLVIIALIMSTSIFFTIMRPALYAFKAYKENPEVYQAKKETLKSIPTDSKVLAYGFYTTPIADIKELYDLDYHNDKIFDETIDFVAVPRAMMTDGSEQSLLIAEYTRNGYVESNLSSTEILILMKQ